MAAILVTGKLKNKKLKKSTMETAGTMLRKQWEKNLLQISEKKNEPLSKTKRREVNRIKDPEKLEPTEFYRQLYNNSIELLNQ